jgi:hypothetical protein
MIEIDRDRATIIIAGRSMRDSVIPPLESDQNVMTGFCPPYIMMNVLFPVRSPGNLGLR